MHLPAQGPLDFQGGRQATEIATDNKDFHHGTPPY